MLNFCHIVYTTLSHDLIKINLSIGLKIRLDVKKFFIWPVMKNGPFFASKEHRKYSLWTCQKVTEALVYLLDTINIRFGSKL